MNFFAVKNKNNLGDKFVARLIVSVEVLSSLV